MSEPLNQNYLQVASAKVSKSCQEYQQKQSSDPDDAQPKEESGQRCINKAMKDLCVLYVEDTPMLQFLINEMSKPFNWILTIAQTGQEGVSLAKDHEYDLVLMDIELGEDSEYDGYEAARRIKKMKPHMIVASFSSNPIKQKEKKCPEIDGHLEQVVSNEQLKEAVTQFLSKIKT